MKDECLDLPSAFILHPSSLLSFVGGGGKTSLMFALARSLPGRVVTTTTTRLFMAQMKLAPAVCYAGDLSDLGDHLARHGFCLVVGEVKHGRRQDKVSGAPPELPGRLLARPDVDYVLVEADGSRMKPVKAPAAHEPVVPPETTLLAPVVGIDAVGGRIRDVAHRPERVAGLLNQCSVFSVQCSVDSVLTAGAVAALLTHPQGGLKNVPATARVIPFINKVETGAQLTAARQIARLVLRQPRIEQVVIGAVKSERPVREAHRRVTAVVLAAGESKRMGRAKQLLPWGETTVLGRTLQNLKKTAVHDILLISGHRAQEIEAIAKTEGIKAIGNRQYATGEMLSSLQTAARHLPENISAVLVILADQPMVKPETIDHLLEAYWQGKGELIAPVFAGKRGNPVLIGRTYFAELLALPNGAAPRDLLRKHQAALRLEPVVSDAVLHDLDSPEDYARWRP